MIHPERDIICWRDCRPHAITMDPMTLALELHLQAKFVKPYLYERFVNAQSWESLAVTAHAQWSKTKRAAACKLDASTSKDVEEVVVIG